MTAPVTSKASADEPGVRVARTYQTFTPAVSGPLVGRQSVLSQVQRLLSSPDARWITLTGPGGIGKTRLAIELARRQLQPVAFVPLADVSSSESLVHVLNQFFEVETFSGEYPVETLARELDSRIDLLILDTLEHLQDSGSVVAQLLARTTRLKVLATSRTQPGYANEHSVQVPPLELTPASAQFPSEAVALFAERAKAAFPAFRLDDRSEADVTNICQLLDGNPFAINLAAARSSLLAPDALLRHLQTDLRVLNHPSPDARFSTVDATIEWSLGLLTEEERNCWMSLGALAGDAGFEAIAAAMGPNVNSVAIATILLQHNLLQAGATTLGEPRFRLQSVARDYARRKLLATGSMSQVRQRISAWLLDYCASLQAGLTGSDPGIWQERTRAVLPDIRMAIRWLQENRRAAEAALLVNRLEWFWTIPPFVGEGRSWCEDLLHKLHPDIDEIELATLYNTAGTLADWQRDTRAATDYYLHSLAIWRKRGDGDRIAELLIGLGSVAIDADEPDRAHAYLEEAHEIASNHWACGASANLLGVVCSMQENFQAAIQHHEQALVALQQGGFTAHTRSVLNGLGIAWIGAGDLQRAWKSLRAALELSSDSELYAQTPTTLEGLAQIALAENHVDLAVQLLAGASRQRTELALGIRPHTERERQHLLHRAQQAAGDASFALNWEIGAAYSLVEINQCARQVPEPGESGIQLSRREREVLQLLLLGQSDVEIAERLFISNRTASKHVASILTKLNAPNRTAAVSIAIRQRIVS